MRLSSQKTLAVLVPLSLFAIGCSSDRDDTAGDSGGKADEAKNDPENPCLPLDSCTGLAEERLRDAEVTDPDHAFDSDLARVTGMIMRLRDDKNDGKTMRGFHAKNHACVQGFVAIINSGSDANVGAVFGAPDFTTFEAWVRFSNGVGFEQRDARGDVRGLALKLLDVSGDRLLEGEDGATTQDLLMTNNPVSVARDGTEFVDFAIATTSDFFTLIKHFRERRDDLTFLLENVVFRKIKTMRTETFWSGSAYSMGTEVARPAPNTIQYPQVMKYIARPKKCSDVELESFDPIGSSHLRGDMAEALAKGTICYDLLVQLQADANGDGLANEMPVENASVLWDECDGAEAYGDWYGDAREQAKIDHLPCQGTKPIKIGELIIPPQKFDKDAPLAAEQFCDSLSFNPWHGVAEYRPLGHINRLRRVVYELSRTMRQLAGKGGGKLAEADVDELSAAFPWPDGGPF